MPGEAAGEAEAGAWDGRLTPPWQPVYTSTRRRKLRSPSARNAAQNPISTG